MSAAQDSLAYLMGILKGDGWVSVPHPTSKYRDYQIGLNVVSEPFALSFKNALLTLGFKPYMNYKPRHTGFGDSNQFMVKAKNRTSVRNFVEWYESLSLKEIERLLTTREEILAFVRGFFESEGSHYLDKRFDNYHIVSICNTNLELSSFVHKLIVEKLEYRAPMNYFPHAGINRMTGEYKINLHGKEAERFITELKPNIKAEPSNSDKYGK